MFNCHSKLNQFYEEKVRLKEKQETLRAYRDKNIERVREGTKRINDKGADVPFFVDNFGQGSLAMHTINQAQNDDDHDIDHALIYDGNEVADDPNEAREVVARALKEFGDIFKSEPEARNNAVTVWYADGYHVDFAVYKVVDERGSKKYFHAGGHNWTPRDPKAITDWFLTENGAKSPAPGSGITVGQGQLRRITRLLKYWAKSRSDWSLPSGLILSALVVERFVSNDSRDDQAFLNTLDAVLKRVKENRDVRNPTDKTISLVISDEHRQQMDSLITRLEKGLIDLRRIVDIDSCDEKSALRAWGDFFGNTWWGGPANLASTRSQTNASADMEIYYTRKDGGGTRRTYAPHSSETIPKGMKIRFRVKPRFSGSFQVRWEVRNTGDEAERNNQTAPRPGQVDPKNQEVCNETTAFRGNHKMLCEITKSDGQKVVIEIPVRIR